MTYTPPEPISARHITAGFGCGQSALDRWLERHALANEVIGRSRTFVVAREDDPHVVGFYCLSTAIVQYADATALTRQEMPFDEPIPAILLGRMAVDLKHQGVDLGAGLLADAVRRTHAIAINAGVRVLLVHAKNHEVQGFYLRYGFEPSPTDELHLMLLMHDVDAIGQ